MHTLTLPAAIQRIKTHPWGLSLLASVLLAVAANIQLPLSPVPVTLQTLVVILISALAGPKVGVGAVLCYLLEAALGFPVMAGFTGGLAHLFSATGGYLMGCLVSVYLMGRLFEHQGSRTFFRAWLISMAGLTVILICGSAYLSQFIGFYDAIRLGVLPFILGESLKAIFAASIIARV